MEPAATPPAGGVAPSRVVGSVPLGALAALLFCLAVPAYVLAVTPGPRNPGWPGALLVLVAVGARYSWIVGRGEQRLIEMTVWLFTYVFLGLAPLVQLREGVSPETTPRVFGAHVTESLLVVGLGSLAFVAGCGLRMLRPGRSRSAEPTPRSDPGVADVGLPRGLWMLGLGALMLNAYYLVQVAPALFTSVDQLAVYTTAVWANTATQGIVKALAIMPLLVTVVTLTLLRLRRRGTRWTLAENALYWASVLALVITVNPVNSPRYVFGTVALSLAGALGLYATGRRFRLVAVGAVLGLLVVFPIADAFRNTSAPGAIQVSPLSALEGGDFDAFAQIDNTLLYVAEYGTTEGRQALGVGFFWVPRAIWADKPEDTGILLADFRKYSFTNLSAPLWAELFINGGWVAVGVGGLAFGWWARGRDDSIVARLRRSRAPGVLDCILPFYFVFLLRGSLLQAMANLVVMLACAWFADRVTREHLVVEPQPVEQSPAAA